MITGTMKGAIADGIVNSYEQSKVTRLDGTVQISSIGPNPGVTISGSEIAIRVCTDARQVRIIDLKSEDEVGRGPLVEREVYFKRFDGRLKGFIQRTRIVESCSA